MTLDGTTMTVNTGYTFNISGALSLAADSNKFIINSSTPKLYMANNATWANATSGLQYANNTLSIKGAITATALNIVTNGTSASIEEYVNGKISGAQVSVTDERIWEGVTNYANGGTNTGGLLITAGQVKLSANDTYIDINTTGIKMEGQHIYINGQKEWSRDDIIVMKSSGNTPADAPWQDTVEHIQNYMEGEAVTINNVTYQRGSAAHDWVLIQPYYDAKLEYSNAGGLPLANSVTLAMTSTSGSQATFGTATWYQYTLSFRCQFNTTVTTNRSRHLHAWVRAIKDNTSLVLEYTSDSTAGSSSGNTVTILSGGTINSDGTIVPSGIIPASNGGTYLISLQSKHINTNLCQEGYSIQVEIRDVQGPASGDTSRVVVTDVNLLCECDATASKVPCTVYYYP